MATVFSLFAIGFSFHLLGISKAYFGSGLQSAQWLGMNTVLDVSERCQLHEIYVRCRTCEGSCENPFPICPEICSPPGCQCRRGYARYGLTCIRPSECPNVNVHNVGGFGSTGGLTSVIGREIDGLGEFGLAGGIAEAEALRRLGGRHAARLAAINAASSMGAAGYGGAGLYRQQVCPDGSVCPARMMCPPLNFQCIQPPCCLPYD